MHEAVRLGANAIGFDIDPIPVLQAKASLARIPLQQKQTVFYHFFETLSEMVTPFFRTECPHCSALCEAQFILHGLRKSSPAGTYIFVDSLILREETDGTSIRLCPYTGEVHKEGVPNPRKPVAVRIHEKGTRQCPVTGARFQEPLDVSFAERYVPLVVVGVCPEHGRFFRKPGGLDLECMARAREHVLKHVDLPYEGLGIHPGPKSKDLLARAISSYADLFTPRQLVYITSAKRLLDQVDNEHKLWLGLLISTSLEFNCLLCGYKGTDKKRPGAIRHVFSHHAYSFPHTALENNPVYCAASSGTLVRLFRDRIEAASRWATAPIERRVTGSHCEKVVLSSEEDRAVLVDSFEALVHKRKACFARQLDSSQLPLPERSIDYVVTDPPYYDSVQYTDLADFFRVWLRWLLPDAAEWDYAFERSAVARRGGDGAHYVDVLSGIWSECNRVLKRPHGLLIFTFHHWSPQAWALLAISLQRAQFRLVESYTIHSENPISVHIRDLKALKHDCILVLKPYSRLGSRNDFDPEPRGDISQSYEFCSYCARVLGYCLERPLREAQIVDTWNGAIAR